MTPSSGGEPGRNGFAAGEVGSPRARVGEFGLRARGLGLEMLRRAYPLGVAAGAVGLFLAGGFARVARGWLDDRVACWGDVVVALGGVPLAGEGKDPDVDLGPVLRRSDAPGLHQAVDELARRAGGRAPAQVRLTYLPCCGVIERNRASRVLVVGMPLLAVLSAAEMRAALAHELAHLARGDAMAAERTTRFLESLTRALDDPGRSGGGPLRWWARWSRDTGARWIAPLAWAWEIRADRFAASVAGGEAAAGALVKVAVVQSVFREVLAAYDPDQPRANGENLYAFFRELWGRIPAATMTSMRHHALSHRASPDEVHPPLVERLALAQGYREQEPAGEGAATALRWLGDPEALERELHDRLYSTVGVEPTVFHRAGT